MDETAIAFELPHVRAAATGGAPLDRISVRDYTRSVEIGAFATERGVTQRLRFNVVLEVGHHAAAQDDCRGLCPVCGGDRNERDCDCERQAPDPRWSALAELKGRLRAPN